jgi:large subunit ribosomal protein L9
VLHPEVVIRVTVNVARSSEEAEKQLRGEAVGRAAEQEPDVGADIFGTEEETPDA